MYLGTAPAGGGALRHLFVCVLSHVHDNLSFFLSHEGADIYMGLVTKVVTTCRRPLIGTIYVRRGSRISRLALSAISIGSSLKYPSIRPLLPGDRSRPPIARLIIKRSYLPNKSNCAYAYFVRYFIENVNKSDDREKRFARF